MMMNEERMKEYVQYEIGGSWWNWVSQIFGGLCTDMIANYYARKTLRKIRRYVAYSRMVEQRDKTRVM